MGGAAVPWFDWSNAYSVVLIAIVVATVVFKLVWSKSKPPPGDLSSSTEQTLSLGVTKINDSLYELYTPWGKPEVDIVLFHGLQATDYRDAYLKTWSRDGKNLWPKTLLGAKLPKARILSVSYDSSARRNSEGGQLDMYVIVESLVSDIILSDESKVGSGNRPVILVGHSLGGLVIKGFILKAWEMRNKCDPKDRYDIPKIATFDNFLRNFRGVFYYATPHQGSKLADLTDRIPGNAEILAFLKTLSKKTARLNEDFRKWRKTNDILAFTMVEGLPTKLPFWGAEIIVTEASARSDIDQIYTSARDDHITICKPDSMQSNNFQLLVKFIRDSVAGGHLTVQENPAAAAQEAASLM